ncbi:MAG: NrfD/PsrC family molybdoenzyme membrane anchor subunit [Rhodospirillales bacterium]
MVEHLNWGLPVIGYLFLAGVGAGALTVSSSVLLRGGGGGFGGRHFKIARYGAFIAPFPIMIGAAMLILELGSFEAGNYLRFLNLFTTINLSPMSIGSWLLMGCLGASLLYAYTFWPDGAEPGDEMEKYRRGLAWVCVPLGISVAVYTGVLLGAMPARPFWNSPVLPMLFLLSAISTGIAVIMLTQTLLHKKSTTEEEHRTHHESGYILTATDLMLICFEVVGIFLFLMFAHLTVGDVKYAVSAILPGGDMASMFWFWVLLVGLVIPGALEMIYVFPRLINHREFAAPAYVEYVVPVAILAGGFMLRYIVVVVGQITGPVGI